MTANTRPPIDHRALRALTIGIGTAIVGAWIAVLAAPPGVTSGLFSSAAANVSSLSAATLYPPTNVDAAALDESTIQLTWEASASGFAEGYDIYRGAAPGGPYAFIDHVPGGGTTSYLDQGLPPETAYSYVLRARHASWESVDSNEASATTLPEPDP